MPNLNDSPQLGPTLLKIGYRTIEGSGTSELENERISTGRLLNQMEARLNARLVDFQRSHRTDLNQLDASISRLDLRLTEHIDATRSTILASYTQMQSEHSRFAASHSDALILLQQELSIRLDAIERRTLLGLIKFCFRKLTRRSGTHAD